MADGIEFKIQGIDALMGKLEGLKYETKRKGGRAALRKAAQLVRDAAKQNASRIDDPLTRESISTNIVERWNGRLFKRTGDLGFRVGVLGGARQYKDNKDNVRKRRVGESYATDGSSQNPGGDTFYWRFVEFGTQRAPARPFMRPALSENLDAASNAFVAEFDKAIDRALKRAKKTGVSA